jgi:hypothetical protein
MLLWNTLLKLFGDSKSSQSIAAKLSEMGGKSFSCLKSTLCTLNSLGLLSICVYVSSLCPKPFMLDYNYSINQYFVETITFVKER